MDFFSLLCTALALAMDAFAMSICAGLSVRFPVRRNALKMATSFGMAQGLMPVIGYYAASVLHGAFETAGNIIAFVLMVLVGTLMILDGRREHSAMQLDAFSLGGMMLLAIATSIDALAVGVSMAAMRAHIWRCAAVIVAITFAVCYCGVAAGHRLGRFSTHAPVVGGVLLILIGVKILLVH